MKEETNFVRRRRPPPRSRPAPLGQSSHNSNKIIQPKRKQKKRKKRKEKENGGRMWRRGGGLKVWRENGAGWWENLFVRRSPAHTFLWVFSHDVEWEGMHHAGS